MREHPGAFALPLIMVAMTRPLTCLLRSMTLLSGVMLLLGVAPRPAQAEDRAAVFVFVGDVLLGGRMGPWLKKHGADYPSKNVQSALQGMLVFGNLECPLTTATEPTPGKSPESIAEKKNFIFRADPALGVLALQSAGFTMMSVANNHAMDYRAVGLMDTVRTLEAGGIKAVGGGKDWDTAAAPRILPIAGFGSTSKMGVLACSMVNPPFSGAGDSTPGTYAVPKMLTPFMAEQIRLLDQKCDFVVLSIHWGVESSPAPTEYQRTIARAAIDAGADLIVGHHPHCLQPIEWYQNKLIAYSLGNFIFPGKSKELPSVILKIYWQGEGDEREETRYYPMLIPVLVRDGIPEFTADPAICAQIRALAPDLQMDFMPVQSS